MSLLGCVDVCESGVAVAVDVGVGVGVAVAVDDMGTCCVESTRCTVQYHTVLYPPRVLQNRRLITESF